MSREPACSMKPAPAAVRVPPASVIVLVARVAPPVTVKGTATLKFPGLGATPIVSE